MTDLLQGTSAFNAAPSAFDADTSSFDATSLDDNLRSISAVERNWRSPQLPNEVKLDLAALPGVTAAGLEGFLQGVDADYNDPEEDPPVEEEEPEITYEVTDPTFERSTFDNIKSTVYDIIGEPQPTEPTSDANAIFKKHAIERGFMERPENGVVDNSWSPELNSIRWEMAQDDYNQRLRGNRDGAMPMSGIADLMTDWMSPGGLLAAATELDLFWDFGAIGNEITSWPDKFRKLGESKNPFDFAANLIDAVTGPVDDIALPILSWAAMFTGVGAMGVAGKAGVTTARAARMGAFSRLYRPQSLSQITQPSMTASRLMKSQGAGRQAMGAAMASWRGYTPVARTKQAVGVGMRLGATSQLQNAFPGYQGGGFQLADIGAVDSARKSLRQTAINPAYLPIELMFSPQNIFLPGTFLGRKADGANLIGNSAKGLYRVFGTNIGRAGIGGAVGAGGGILLGEDGGDVLRGAAAGAVGLGGGPKVGGVVSRRLNLSQGAIKAGKDARRLVSEGKLTAKELQAAQFDIDSGRVASRNIIAAQGVVGAGIGTGVTVIMDENPDALDLLKGAALGGGLGTGIGMRSSWARRHKDSPGAIEKAIGFVADAAQTIDYRPIAENQQVSRAFDNAIRFSLRGDDAGLATYQQGWDETGTQLGAFRKLFEIVDDNQAAAAMAYLMKSAAIDRAATGYAGKKFNRSAYHFYRNKLTAQARQFDMSDDVTTLMDDAAAAYAWTNSSTKKQWADTFQQIRDQWAQDPSRALAFMADHNEQALKLNRQLMSPQVIDDLDPSIDFASRLSMSNKVEENLSTLEAYLIQDTGFQRWNEFTTQTAEIGRLDANGILDAAQLAPAYSMSSGMEIGYKGFAPKINRYAQDVDNQMMNLIFRQNTTDPKKLFGGRLAPLARLNPQGRFTVMKADTPTAGQLVSLRRDLKELLGLQRSLRNLPKGIRSMEAAVGDVTTMDAATLTAAVKAATTQRGASKSMLEVQKFAKRLGLSGTDLEQAVAYRIDEILNDADFWNQTGVSRFTKNSDGVVPIGGEAAINQRISQLDEAVQYTAAEIDLVSLARYHDEAGDVAKAAEVRALADGLEGDGYKLVHGVEYQMPQDLIESTMDFGYMTTQNMHSATIGNYFKGRMPSTARALEERRQRVALANSFQAQKLDLAADSDEAGEILADMRAILKEEQTSLAQRLRQVENEPRIQRPLTYVKTSLTPLRLEDLIPYKKMVITGLTDRGWSAAKAEAAWMAVPRFRNTEFKDMGIYALEAELRSRSQLVDALKLMGGSKWLSPQRMLVGAGIGAGVAVATENEGESEDTSRGRMLAVGAIGAATAFGLGAAARPLIPASQKIKMGYLANNLVRARDSLRFTLSPFFDLSRYTEGLMLGQAAAPLRAPNGQRFIMPVNSSPSKLKKMLKKNPVKNPDGSTVNFDDLRAEFKAAAIGDFDPDVLDEAGRWFSQVGVLGFNPTNWMSTAFGHMRQAGFSADEAYKNARGMYTYGTRGRSAAELSVNFIFFPFSFQKKALTHLGDFITDDLSRSLILHDAFKTYEILDERYDLNEMWKDHVPAMRNLGRLNMFAFGISPGRFGGINAQAAESASKLALSTIIAPQGMSIKDRADAAELTKLYRSVMPVVNDINWMVKDVKETGHVLMSESHMTTKAEIREGYAEWNEVKTNVTEGLKAQGYTLADMHNKPWLSDLKMYYEGQRAELNAKYPAWQNQRRESVGNRVALEMEKKDRLLKVEQRPLEASDADFAFYDMESLLSELSTTLRYKGFEVGGNDGWADAPPEVFTAVLAWGVELRETIPGWQSVWKKFYEDEWGFLEAPI